MVSEDYFMVHPAFLDGESVGYANGEWGAVVYLTESTYGRNGNYVAKSDQGYITGGGAGNAYLTYTNQSSTGNEYGIYDLNGCSKEFVACYI